MYAVKKSELPNVALHVITYHYVRDPTHSQFPGIKGILPDRYKEQVVGLKARYEMATLESALNFLKGSYKPSRDLCLLTFDDGLKDHYVEVAPLLVEMGLQGFFFVITSCLEENTVAAVHMNHLLMASMDFDVYERAFMRRLNDRPFASHLDPKVDPKVAQNTYRWDEPKIASFKYLLNFALAPAVRDQVLKLVFEKYLGKESSLAPTVYLSWEEGRRMQEAGMVLGGHSHRHAPLANLTQSELEQDLNDCMSLLIKNLRSQYHWPFCYPYGTPDSFNHETKGMLKQVGFACSFTTETGSNPAGSDLFSLRRVDCNDADRLEATAQAQPGT